MEIRPILSSLLRNRAGAVLVAVQIALTLAIVVNAVYVTKQRVEKVGRPSGLDDQNIFWVAATAFEKDYDFAGMVRDDLAMLRAMPDVVNATPMNQIPLSGSGSSSTFFSQPNEKGEEAPANLFPVDEHGVDTLGVTLTAGKTFAATDVEHRRFDDPGAPPVAIVSQALVTSLFGKEPGLGKTFYDQLSKPYKIVGVIGHMHGSWVGWDKVDHIILQPMIRPGSVRYTVRAEPGTIDAVMTAVETALRKRDPNRVIGTMKKMSDGKKRSYSADILMSVTLTIVTGLVLVFSALGIFGLATFNVNTRTRQIGTRRAIGARRRDIVRYFMTENWLVTSLGVVIGCCLALAAGYWLSTQHALPRLDLYYLVGGVLGLWIVGQLAAWQPALKAAKVSPAMATRNV
jgi:putative ABC transport system permease protein